MRAAALEVGEARGPARRRRAGIRAERDPRATGARGRQRGDARPHAPPAREARAASPPRSPRVHPRCRAGALARAQPGAAARDRPPRGPETSSSSSVGSRPRRRDRSRRRRSSGRRGRSRPSRCRGRAGARGSPSARRSSDSRSHGSRRGVTQTYRLCACFENASPEQDPRRFDHDGGRENRWG